MKYLKMLVMGGAASLAVAGGLTALESAGGSSSLAAPVVAASVVTPTAGPTIHQATSRVDGRSERILEAANGLPLYTYEHDTPTVSKVTGGLAQLWPPLLSRHPTDTGRPGKVTVIDTANGSQVRYDGHFLYTFVSDTPGHVTGQGVQDFFVATPSGTAPRSAPPAAAPALGY